jgi:hypothetical protein
MKHDVKTILIKAFTGKHRNWAIVLTTLLALLITTGIISSVQVRITAEQPSTYAQSPNHPTAIKAQACPTSAHSPAPTRVQAKAGQAP